ncbi:MAG: FISUMP domain-containing protein [Bacteroidales bacterium]
MKKFFLAFIVILISCIPENSPPECEILSPAQDSEFTRGDDIVVRTDVSDEDGDIDEVRLYVDSIGIASTGAFPYSFTFSTGDMNVGYHSIRVQAFDNYGKTSDAFVSFLLVSDLPAVETTQPRSVARDSAVVGGRIIDDGGTAISAAGIRVAGEPFDGNDSDELYADLMNGLFEVTLHNLEYETYYVTAFAENESGRSYGNEISFMPLPPENIPPLCEIELPAGGAEFTRGDDISININASDEDGDIEQVRLFLNSIGITTLRTFPYRYVFSSEGVEAGSYILRAEANDNSGGISGDSVSFIINPELPVVETSNPTSITTGSAVVGGTILDDGGGDVIAAGILWGTEPDDVSGYSEIPADITGNTFSVTLTDLEYDIYYIVAFAENESGRSYGEQISFTPLLPEDMFVDSRDGNAYKWVQIGNQIWMAENLAYLPELRNPRNYSAEEPFYYVYDYNRFNLEEATETYNYNTYGVLYNHPAAVEACPDGWHLPTSGEQQELISFIGGEDEVGKLMEAGTEHWNSNPEGTNTTGFSALGAGQVVLGPDDAMVFEKIGEAAGWWTSDTCNADLPDGIPFVIESSNPVIFTDDDCQPFETGYSVRCIKD